MNKLIGTAMYFFWYASILTTERYLGCKQNLEQPVNDRFGCLFSGDVDSNKACSRQLRTPGWLFPTSRLPITNIAAVGVSLETSSYAHRRQVFPGIVKGNVTQENSAAAYKRGGGGPQVELEMHCCSKQICA